MIWIASPYNALRDLPSYKPQPQPKTLADIYWDNLSEKERNTLRKQYNEVAYDDYKDVAEYAYSIRIK
jgi:hypothetical protein